MAEGLAREVKFLKGVGPRAAPLFEKLGVRTVGDLLRHYPRRHQDRRNLPPIALARDGEFVTVRGRIVNFTRRPTRGGMVILTATIRDASGAIGLTWFNQPWVAAQLERVEGEVIAYGLAKEGSYGLTMASPEWEAIEPGEDAAEFLRLTPIYPSTEGLGQFTIRRAVGQALDLGLGEVEDPLPPSFRKAENLPDLRWAISQMHRPDSEADRDRARRRLVFEEFLYLQLGLAFRRDEMGRETGIPFPIARLLAGESVEPPLRHERGTDRAGRTGSVVAERRKVTTDLFAGERAAQMRDEPLWESVGRILPFELTGAQKRVIGEIWEDMAAGSPMNRLLQGDVGSGKTAVAAAAILACVRSGYQAALMAPTEILAEQHEANLRRLFEPSGVRVELLVGKQGVRERTAAARRVAEGVSDLVVGTHALIQEGVEFRQLGLAVVDEQHRFGVLQRKALRDKSAANPDVLVMTATPIPRTLTMTLYGDLDVSILDELPPGRTPIVTHRKAPEEREAVYAGVRSLVEKGQQAYFVCPLVGETEKVQALAATELHAQLKEEVFPDLRVELLHGQMKPREKEEAMERFRRHESDILVSTTVIEVGVDVPNATTMVIEDADRFGLSQLHQLRGRVGRGAKRSFCVLVSGAKAKDAEDRLAAMVETTDGFRIADADLRLRGPGNMAGTEQSGRLDFKIADLALDAALLTKARDVARRLVSAGAATDPAWAAARAEIPRQRAELALVAIS